MFLATTALDQYWDKDQKILFLGDWCITNESKATNLDYEILPYHWRNLDEAERASWYLYDLYNRLIPEISAYMNKIHSKEFSQRYWEILIGPWLWMFIPILYDRFLSIKYAITKYKNLSTYIDTKLFIPDSYSSFYDLINSDTYNFYLYSQIITNLKHPIKITKINDEIDYYRFQYIKKGQNTSPAKHQINYRYYYLLVKKMLKQYFLYPLRSIKNYIFFVVGQNTNNFYDIGKVRS